MGFLKRDKSVEELEDEREKVKIQADTASYRSQIAEREAVVKQLKRQYGGGWQKLLGVTKNTDMSTLKSFLTGAKSGAAKSGVIEPGLRSRLWGNLGK